MAGAARFGDLAQYPNLTLPHLSLPYDEPWGWMQPTRHALGALLLEQGRVAEAEQVYRDDLGLNSTLSRASQHPDNVWSLHGYVECLHKLHKHHEAMQMEQRLEQAKAWADVPSVDERRFGLGIAHQNELDAAVG